MSTKIIPCGKGFVGKRGGQRQAMPGVVSGTMDTGAALSPRHPEYLDRGGEWLPSAGGAPETVATKPFATRDAAQSGIDARAVKDGDAMRANAGELRPVNYNYSVMMFDGDGHVVPPHPDVHAVIAKFNAERRRGILSGIVDAVRGDCAVSIPKIESNFDEYLKDCPDPAANVPDYEHEERYRDHACDARPETAFSSGHVTAAWHPDVAKKFLPELQSVFEEILFNCPEPPDGIPFDEQSD